MHWDNCDWLNAQSLLNFMRNEQYWTMNNVARVLNTDTDSVIALKYFELFLCYADVHFAHLYDAFATLHKCLVQKREPNCMCY